MRRAWRDQWWDRGPDEELSPIVGSASRGTWPTQSRTGSRPSWWRRVEWKGWKYFSLYRNMDMWEGEISSSHHVNS